MENLKIRKKTIKLIATGLIISLLASGCSSKENNAEPITNDTNITMENNNPNTEDNTPENTINEEFDCFESETEEVNNIIYTEGIEKASEVWKEYFIDAVGFIFFDEEYKNTIFNDLPAEKKDKTIETITTFSNKMDELSSDWRLGDIKNVSINTYYNILEYIKDLIGEDKYNTLKGIKDSIKNGGIDIYNILKDSYENYKSKNK